MLRFPNRSALHELLDSALSDHICAHTHTLTVAKHTNSFICLANLEYSCEYYNNNNAQRTECNNGQRAKDEFGAPAAATTNITFKQTFWAGPIGKSGWQQQWPPFSPFSTTTKDKHLTNTAIFAIEACQIDFPPPLQLIELVHALVPKWDWLTLICSALLCSALSFAPTHQHWTQAHTHTWRVDLIYTLHFDYYCHH